MTITTFLSTHFLTPDKLSSFLYQQAIRYLQKYVHPNHLLWKRLRHLSYDFGTPIIATL